MQKTAGYAEGPLFPYAIFCVRVCEKACVERREGKIKYLNSL